MTVPHNSWASVYDLAYQQTHSNYTRFLNVTLDVVKEAVKPSASVVDFGAGTGRIAIPLASLGYDVTAVEPSYNMLEELKRKKDASNVETINCKMQDFQPVQQFDMALCVFTVIAYLLDEDSLKHSVAAIASSLRPGGLLLIDIPKRSIFRSYQSSKPLIERSVKITPIEGSDLFQYLESIKETDGNESREYSDEFRIRYWDFSELLAILEQNNLSIQQDLTDRFSGSGSKYLMMTKGS